ncbi:HAD family hydrolase [Papillibacter cinnamivorans]|uniref:Haloacid dehalogenase superfamily, subfamily IA, variant 3 with third motif having DD or ED n=1 Tax=Papillibacter cinnamivorans DSM 12816 TaxID=1122930 RepID=A0A1W1ZGF6_9FIRM|nr:HAD family phosphatase [Papillibacter cinnamivorans]SMC47590.1 haloacid dehalogenase superfamily, subfamily IA, variant 3 with third motif having DD or ED [Papillibacter cinnamivorans DSM 12816]
MYIFDLDGTLIDSNGVWVQIDLDFLSRRGLSVTEEYTEFVTHATYQNAAGFTKEYFSLPETPEEIMKAWSDMAFDAYAHTVPLKDGVREFLFRCGREGLPMAVATSCMPHLCDAALRQHGIRDLFQAVITADEAGCDKRNPEIYLMAARRLEAAPEECTVFEDSPAAVLSARSAGMRVVGVYDSFFAPWEEEMRRRCHGYIRSFRELL